LFLTGWAGWAGYEARRGRASKNMQMDSSEEPETKKLKEPGAYY
jgi:hypothetical protein